MTQPTPLPIETDCEETSVLLSTQADFVFIDCREPSEYETAHIEGTELIPMSVIQDHLEDLAKHADSRIIVHCHHGGRSLRVARWLRTQGFHHAQSLAGGIDAWSERIDPSIPRY